MALRSKTLSSAFCVSVAMTLLQGCARDKEAIRPEAPGSTASKSATKSGSGTRLDYPAARRQEQVDVYHGVEVADPYRWLEDPDSEESRRWIEAENELTFGWLAEIPARERLKKRLTALWNYEKYGIPFKEGGRYFYSYNPGLLNQSQLYTMASLAGAPRLLLDPNTLSEDGTVALAGMAVSRDGRHLAYSISDGGSDWQEWRVREVESGKDLDDRLSWSKFSGASFSHDGKGFYYSAYDPPADKEALTGTNYHQKLYYHLLNTPQSQDRLVYERPDEKEWGFDGQVTEDGRYLLIHVWRGTDPKNGLFYQDLMRARSKPKVVELLDKFDALYQVIGNQGTLLFVRTDLDAPRSRVIAIDLELPDRKRWREVIPESEETLESVSLVGGRLVASYLEHAVSKVKIFDLNGKLEREVVLPGLGSVNGLGGHHDDPETFYSFTSFTRPPTLYRYDVATGAQTLFRETLIDFAPDGYETRQIFYQSKDGTRVPMFITHKKGLALDGKRPTYLYGYGGFNISLTPWFSPKFLVWLELGGVLAVANLRGGNEYGEAWHQAGIKGHKQNVFDDFIAAAEWLEGNGYTSPANLAIGGASNGGLLVGACLTQRPELYAAALPAVGVLDMLRYHTWTIGWAWATDYGTVDDADEFKALYAYSPYHNVRPGARYPATFITTADHDDRVVPAHSFKFAAALQHAQAGPAPVLIRIETRAGHGRGKPTTKQIEEAADRWAFVVRALGMSVPE